MLHVGLYKDSKWGFWYVDVPAALTPTGRRWRRSTGSRDKRTAEKIRAQVEEGRLDALLGGKSLRSRQDFEKAYFEFLEVSDAHGPRTVDLYKEIIPRVLDACSWPPTEEELLRYWKGRMEAKESRIRPITANKECRAVHAALQWAVNRDMINSNPCSGIPWFELKGEQREVREPIIEILQGGSPRRRAGRSRSSRTRSPRRSVGPAIRPESSDPQEEGLPRGCGGGLSCWWR